MSENGLTGKDEKALQAILRKAEAIVPGYAYLGAGERAQNDKLIADVRRRLEPDSVDELSERANQTFEPLASFEWAQRAWADLK